jgi:hypothetical protein
MPQNMEMKVFGKKQKPKTVAFTANFVNTKYAYTTENGILVVPIGCLKN